jgi:hypothetical protein
MSSPGWIAPQLHRKRALRADRLAASVPTEDQSSLRPRRGQTGLSIPVVSAANIRSLYPRRSRSDQAINWFGGFSYIMILEYQLESYLETNQD